MKVAVMYSRLPVGGILIHYVGEAFVQGNILLGILVFALVLVVWWPIFRILVNHFAEGA